MTACCPALRTRRRAGDAALINAMIDDIGQRSAHPSPQEELQRAGTTT